MHEIQEFAQALLDPALMTPRSVAGASTRFDVYRNNVVSGLTNVLADTFPVVQRMVGEDYFSALAGAFIRQQPPSERIAALYGRAFPAFLASFEPLREYGYLPDLARLEWARLEAWHAADHPVAEKRLHAQPDRMLATQLMLHPSARIVTSEWPIASLWEAHQLDEFQSPDDWEGETLAILRTDEGLMHARLAPAHARLIVELENAASLGDVLAGLGREDIAAEALVMISGLLRAGCIVPTMNNYW